MGGGVSLQQLQQLPEVLDQDLFAKLVKDKKFAPECYSIFADYNGMISRKRLQEICVTRDCYLSYEWGIDTKGRATHRRVAQIADYLAKKKGLILYAEDGQYRNNMSLANLSLQERIQQSLATSSCMLVFFTKRYFEKFVEEKRVKRLPSAALFTTLQQQQRGVVVPKKKNELEHIRREEEKALEEVEENQIQLEFRIFRALQRHSTRCILPVVLEDKAALDFAPQELKDHFGHRLIINASRLEEHPEEVLDGLFDYIVKTITPMRLGGPFLQRNQIYGQTDEGKLLIWLRKCLGVQNKPVGSGNSSQSCAEETIAKYLRILLEENMNSFLKLYGVMQVDDQYLIRLGFQEAHSLVIYSRLEKEIKGNLMMEKIRQIDIVMAKQKEKQDLEQQKYHEEINEVVENAKKMKEMTLMAGEDTLSYTMRAYEQQIVKSATFEQMQVKFFKQLLDDQLLYQEKVSELQELLWDAMEERIVGDRLQRLQQILDIDSIDNICDIFRNTIAELERTLTSTTPAMSVPARRGSVLSTGGKRGGTFSEVVSASASPNMSRRSSAFIPPNASNTAEAVPSILGSPSSVVGGRKEIAGSKFKALVRYGVTHQLTVTGDFEASVQDLSELSYLLQLSSTILHKIQQMSQDHPEQVSRFVDQGISKLLLTLLAKGYMYTSQYPSLFALDHDNSTIVAFDPRQSIHEVVFQHHRKLYLPHQVMLTMSSLMQCQLDKHSLHEQLVYLFGKAGTIDLMVEIIKFHMEHLSVVVLCLHVIDMLLSTSQAPIRQSHIQNFLQNYSYILLLMILLEKYDLQHLDEDLEEEGASPDAKRAQHRPHAAHSTHTADTVPHDRTSLTLQYVALRIYIVSIFSKCAVFSQEMVLPGQQLQAQRRNSMLAGSRSHAGSRRGSAVNTTTMTDPAAELVYNYYQELLSKSRPALVSRAVNELLVWYIQQHPHIIHRAKKDDTAPFLTPTKQREATVAKAQEDTLKSVQPALQMTDDLLLALISTVEVLYLDRRKVYLPTHLYHRDENNGELHPVNAEEAMALLTVEARRKQSEAMKKRLQEIDAKIAKDLQDQEDARKKKLQAKQDITSVHANHREILEQLAKEEEDAHEKARQLAREQRRQERIDAKKAQAEERRKQAEEAESKQVDKKKQVGTRWKRSLRENMTVLLNEFYLVPFLVHQLRGHRTNSTIVIAIVRSLGNMLYLREDLKRRANEFALSGELMLILKEGLKLFRQHHANKKGRHRATSPERIGSPDRAGESHKATKQDAASHSSKLHCRKLGIEILRETFITLANYFTVLSPDVDATNSNNLNDNNSTAGNGGNFLYPSWDCIHLCVDQGLCEAVLEIFSQSQLDNKLLHATLLLIHKMIQCGNFLTCSRLVAIGFIEKLGLFLDMNMAMDSLIFELTCQILISLARSDEIRINAGKRLIEKTRADSWLIAHIRRLCLAKGTNGHWSHFYSHAILDTHPKDVSEVSIALSSTQSSVAAATATNSTTLPSFNQSINSMYQTSTINLPGAGKTNTDPALKKKVCNACILGCTMIHTLCKHSTHGQDFLRKIRIAGFQQWLHKAPLVVGEERDMVALPKNLDIPQMSTNNDAYRHPKSTPATPSMHLLHHISDVPLPEQTMPSDSEVKGGEGQQPLPANEAPPAKATVHFMLPVDSMLDNAHLPFQDRSVELVQNISKTHFDELIQDVFRMFNVDYGPLLIPLDDVQGSSRHK